MESATEHAEPLPRATVHPGLDRLSAGSATVALGRSRWLEGIRLERVLEIVWRARFVIAVYLATRGLLLLTAIVNGELNHHSLMNQLAHWDGLWYRSAGNRGYPAYVPHGRSTLGFFPLYPITIWLVGHVFSALTPHSAIWCVTWAGIVVSGVGGLVAAVLVQRLAAGWWGEDTGRRAAVLFCLFPGSVVFSMVYAEGLLLPLVAGCILALQKRRWLLAGALAGLATATEPEALALILVCAISAGRELRRRGWGNRSARRSLLVPLLSLTGIAGFAAFLWAWTGTPFASLLAQRYGWQERTDPLALVHLAQSLAQEVSFTHFNHPTINLNLVVGLGGALLLLVLLVLLLRSRREVSVEAIAWTLGISFLAVTSEYTPPNPRLLVTAFPAVLVGARYLRTRGFWAAAWLNGALLIGMSALTFAGTTLRP